MSAKKADKKKEYTVDGILDRRTEPDGSHSYLTSWKGSWDNTWQPRTAFNEAALEFITELEGFLDKGAQKPQWRIDFEEQKARGVDELKIQPLSTTKRRRSKAPATRSAESEKKANETLAPPPPSLTTPNCTEKSSDPAVTLSGSTSHGADGKARDQSINSRKRASSTTGSAKTNDEGETGAIREEGPPLKRLAMKAPPQEGSVGTVHALVNHECNIGGNFDPDRYRNLLTQRKLVGALPMVWRSLLQMLLDCSFDREQFLALLPECERETRLFLYSQPSEQDKYIEQAVKGPKDINEAEQQLKAILERADFCHKAISLIGQQPCERPRCHPEKRLGMKMLQNQAAIATESQIAQPLGPSTSPLVRLPELQTPPDLHDGGRDATDGARGMSAPL